MSEFIVFGHRGASAHAPENTLLSMRTALTLGAAWVEVDVYSVSGELVVIHDDRLERTTNGLGYVQQTDLEILRKLDAGQGEQIPFLSEILDLLQGRAGINIELKGVGTAAPVAAIIRRYLTDHNWQAEQFLVSSFNHHELAAFKEIYPEIRIGALTASLPLDYARFGEELHAYSVHVSIEFINADFVAEIHRRGMKCFVYTVNHLEDLVRLKAMGADGIFTDHLELGNSEIVN